MSVYRELGIKTLINAKGPATRLSGGIMRPEVSAAMMEASQSCVDISRAGAAMLPQDTGLAARTVCPPP